MRYTSLLNVVCSPTGLGEEGKHLGREKAVNPLTPFSLMLFLFRNDRPLLRGLADVSSGLEECLWQKGTESSTFLLLRTPPWLPAVSQGRFAACFLLPDHNGSGSFICFLNITMYMFSYKIFLMLSKSQSWVL